MKRAVSVCLAAGALVAGCALPLLTPDSPGVVEPQRMAPDAALAAVHRGDTQAQVAAALGPANVIAFESGWQVWIYRWTAKDDRSPDAATEVDVLFDPSALVRKARLRPGVKPAR